MHQPESSNRFTAILLSGDRGPNDPLVMQSNASCKALIHIDGAPMLLRVIEGLSAAQRIDRIVLSGPRGDQLGTEPKVRRLVDTGEVSWLPPEISPSTSAYQAMQSLPPNERVLITTADHPLLRAEIVDRFCTDSLATGADITVGLAPYALVREAFPDMKKTVLRFSDGEYCGCNLFAFMTTRGRQIADYWRQVETQRKNPLKVVGLLGWLAVLRYRFGMLSLDSALGSLSRRLDLQIGAVVLPYADAAVDVDSIADYTQVERKLVNAGR